MTFQEQFKEVVAKLIAQENWEIHFSFKLKRKIFWLAIKERKRYSTKKKEILKIMREHLKESEELIMLQVKTRLNDQLGWE